MLVGEAVNVARFLRDAAKDVKDGVKSSIELTGKVIKAGQAVFSSAQRKFQELAEKNAKKEAAKKAAQKEANKQAKKENKNKEGVQR